MKGFSFSRMHHQITYIWCRLLCDERHKEYFAFAIEQCETSTIAFRKREKSVS